MYRRIYTCRRCGKEFVVEYETEYQAKLGRRVYCSECKKIVEKEKAKEGYAQKMQREGIGAKPQSTSVNKACDRFFEKRGMHIEDSRSNLFLETEVRNEAKAKDVIDAINYGVAAYERYKKLVKRQEGNHEQTQEGANAGDHQRNI